MLHHKMKDFAGTVVSQSSPDWLITPIQNLIALIVPPQFSPVRPASFGCGEVGS